MLEYLIKFNQDDLPVIQEELDISDRSILQEQINKTRKGYLNLIKLYDKLKSERMSCNQQVNEKKREIYEDFIGRNDRSDAIFNNLDIQLLLANIEAYDLALETIKNQIDFLKSDLRILTNSMYNKN